MYRKSKKQIERLELIEEFNEADMNKLRNLSYSKNQEIRSKVAALLGLQYDSRNETILYHLSYDKDEIVKLEAIDSLSIGKRLCSLQRLEILCHSRDYYIRFFAIQSHCDVYINIFGGVKDDLEYHKKINSLLRVECNPLVKLALYKSLFLCGNKDAIKKIIDILVRAIKDNNYSLISPALNILDEIIVEPSHEFTAALLPLVDRLDRKQADLVLSIV